MDDTASEFQKLIGQAMAVAPDEKTARAALDLLRSGAGALPEAQIAQADETVLPVGSADRSIVLKQVSFDQSAAGDEGDPS